MDQTEDLLETLKRCLRTHDLGYRQVAKVLKLSEASVKRLFSEGSFSLRRIETVCRMMDMTLFDLAQLTQARRAANRRVLSLDQERALADDPSLLHCFYLLLNGWQAGDIGRENRLETPALVALLTRLDRIGLIELLPDNAVRLLTARNIDWRPGGPVRARYEPQMRKMFISEEEDAGGEAFRFASGELSNASMRIMERRMERLLREFEDLVELDMSLPHKQRENTGLMMVFRPWEVRLIGPMS